MQQVGRPPEEGHEFEYGYDAIGLEISYRNKYDQKASGLDGGRGIVGSQMSSSREPNKVYCRVTFRYSTWAELHACTDTLVRQPPYLVTRGWEEVVPLG